MKEKINLQMGNLIHLNEPGKSPTEIFQMILAEYQEKHGVPPLIIEYSRLMGWKNVKDPQGCIVRSISLPINHFLVGVSDD